MDARCRNMELVDVALRKESVDRNSAAGPAAAGAARSLSARRAWIEITPPRLCSSAPPVALRKESVDRNQAADISARRGARSLSARRAWIEIALLVYLALIR